MGHDASDARTRRSRRVAIIGAGPGGICTGVRLLEARPPGLRDPREGRRASAAPGSTTATRAPSATSSRTSTRSRSSPSRLVADRTPGSPRSTPTSRTAWTHFGLEPYLRLGTEVHAARWDDDAAVWHLTVGDGEVIDADVVVSALGMFGAPVAPDIPGLDRFRGTIFHSAALGRRPRPHRRVGRGDRQRGERGAARPRDRADRRRAHRVPADGELGLAEGRPAVHRGPAGDLRRRSRHRHRGARRHLHHHRSQPHVRRPDAPRAWRKPPASRTSRWSRTPRCGASSRRTCRSGANDRWRRTSTTRRSTCRTSSS